MFRMLRLIVLGLVGYMVYEFIQGLSHGRFDALSQLAGGSSRGPRRRGDSNRGDRSGGDPNRGDMNRGVRPGVGSMTGRGQGQRVQTEDASGTGGSHIVGRGVVM